jgi:hypothetical protein
MMGNAGAVIYHFSDEESECLKNLIANLHAALQQFQSDSVSSPVFDARRSSVSISLAALYAERGRQISPNKVPQDLADLLRETDKVAEQFCVIWENLQIQSGSPALFAKIPALESLRTQIVLSIRYALDILDVP